MEVEYELSRKTSGRDGEQLRGHAHLLLMVVAPVQDTNNSFIEVSERILGINNRKHSHTHKDL